MVDIYALFEERCRNKCNMISGYHIHVLLSGAITWTLIKCGNVLWDSQHHSSKLVILLRLLYKVLWHSHFRHTSQIQMQQGELPKNKLSSSPRTEKEAKRVLTWPTTYLGKQQGANNAQSGLKVIFQPQPHGVDAASHVDDIEQLQALEEGRKEAPKSELRLWVWMGSFCSAKEHHGKCLGIPFLDWTSFPRVFLPKTSPFTVTVHTASLCCDTVLQPPLGASQSVLHSRRK